MTISLDSKGGTGFGASSSVSGNKNGPKAEQDYQCPAGYESCPSCGYGLGASCKYGTETQYSRCRHQDKYRYDEKNCNGDYEVGGDKCTIKDSTKYTQCNCTYEHKECTGDYECGSRKCNNLVCDTCKCKYSGVSCSGAGYSCTDWRCDNTVCMNCVCTMSSVSCSHGCANTTTACGGQSFCTSCKDAPGTPSGNNPCGDTCEACGYLSSPPTCTPPKTASYQTVLLNSGNTRCYTGGCDDPCADYTSTSCGECYTSSPKTGCTGVKCTLKTCSSPNTDFTCDKNIKSQADCRVGTFVACSPSSSCCGGYCYTTSSGTCQIPANPVCENGFYKCTNGNASNTPC